MKFFVSLITCLFAFAAYADEAPLKNFQVNGWGFVRNEHKNNADYDSDTKDKTEATQTRINVSVKADLADNYGYVFIAPQFSKISGQNEFAASSATANSSNGTSGALYDSRLDMHEAYFAFKPTHDDNLFIFAGRQELAYGDHLILGSVPWHRIGRSFDGAKVRYGFATNFNVDVFSMTLNENNGTSSSISSESDTTLNGAYITGTLGAYAKAVDFYILKRDNNQTATSPFKDTSAYGVRVKSKVGESAFDYRAEITLEQNKMSADDSKKSGEKQMDLEVGYTLPFFETRLGVEYFDSTKDFDQLFPTAHKFLGYADQFSRRNIQGYAAHLLTKPYEKVVFTADYHVFQRHDNDSAAYGFAGTNTSGLGTVGSSRDIANEVDLILAYDFTKTLQLSYGYSIVTVGKYLKDQGAEDDTKFSYLQLLARF